MGQVTDLGLKFGAGESQVGNRSGVTRARTGPVGRVTNLGLRFGADESQVRNRYGVTRMKARGHRWVACQILPGCHRAMRRAVWSGAGPGEKFLVPNGFWREILGDEAPLAGAPRPTNLENPRSYDGF